MCCSLLFNKVSGLRLKTLLKKRLQHRCFLANFAKFLRTHFLRNTSGQLLLTFLFYKVSVNGYLYKKFSRNLVKMLDWPCLKIAYLNVKNICNSKVQAWSRIYVIQKCKILTKLIFLIVNRALRWDEY